MKKKLILAAVVVAGSAYAMQKNNNTFDTTQLDAINVIHGAIYKGDCYEVKRLLNKHFPVENECKKATQIWLGQNNALSLARGNPVMMQLLKNPKLKITHEDRTYRGPNHFCITSKGKVVFPTHKVRVFKIVEENKPYSDNNDDGNVMQPENTLGGNDDDLDKFDFSVLDEFD